MGGLIYTYAITAYVILLSQLHTYVSETDGVTFCTRGKY